MQHCKRFAQNVLYTNAVHISKFNDAVNRCNQNTKNMTSLRDIVWTTVSQHFAAPVILNIKMYFLGCIVSVGNWPGPQVHLMCFTACCSHSNGWAYRMLVSSNSKKLLINISLFYLNVNLPYYCTKTNK